MIVKLTPNVTDITHIALAAERGGADAVSLINTINSLMGVDLETFAPRPNVAGKSSHGGYCGPAVKPIALHLVSAVAKKVKIPIVGIGGIGTGRMRPNTSRWAPPACRSAPPPCTTAFASSKTWPTA